MTERKETNPKDAVGIRKVPMFSVIPRRVIGLVALAMMEGARKYGRHNYREAGVRASVYLDAMERHVSAFYEGQDIDEDSQLPHLAKAIASLVVLLDGYLSQNWVDDRPPMQQEEDDNWIAGLNSHASNLIDRIPESKEPFTQLRRLKKLEQEIREEGVVSEKFSEPKMETSLEWETVDCPEEGRRFAPKRDPLKVDGAVFVGRQKSIFSKPLPAVEIPYEDLAKVEPQKSVWSVQRGVELVNDYELGTQFDGARLMIGEGTWKIISKKLAVAAKPDTGRQAVYSYDLERVA